MYLILARTWGNLFVLNVNYIYKNSLLSSCGVYFE